MAERDSPTSEPRPSPGGRASAPKRASLAVTPEMAEAGLGALKREMADDYSQFPMAHQTIAAVFRAMVRVAPPTFWERARSHPS